MYVVIDQSSPLPISIFLSLCLLFHPPYTRTSNQLAYMQACMVCMCACVHIGVHCWQDGVSLRGSNTDGNPSYGSVGWKPLVWVCHVSYYFPIETRETSRTGLPSVGVYTCMYLRMYMHGCIYMRVCGWDWVSCMDTRAKELKKGYRIDIAKWMCVPRDCVCVRTWENNLLMTSSVRHVNDTN